MGGVAILAAVSGIDYSLRGIAYLRGRTASSASGAKER